MSVTTTPSSVQVFSPESAPLAMKFDCCPDSAPPTLTRSTMTPGTVCSTTHGSRADGTFCSSSTVMWVSVLWRRGSMTGASLETSTVSVTPPTERLAFSGVEDAARTCTPVLRYTRNPGKVMLSSYVPTGSRSMCASPRRSVKTLDRSSGPMMDTAAPGSTAPVPSSTVRSIRPRLTCAAAGVASRTISRPKQAVRLRRLHRRFMSSSSVRVCDRVSNAAPTLAPLNQHGNKRPWAC